jgi:hypothetical protein
MINNPYQDIKTRSLKVRPGKRGPWIKKHGERVNLETINSHSDTKTGLTYIFNREGTQVKHYLNYM